MFNNNFFCFICLLFITSTPVLSDNENVTNDYTQHVTSRIVGGVEATQVYPWLASLQIGVNGIFRHTCGASLINRNWMLTAAHCVHGLQTQNFRIVLGASRLSQINNAETILVKEIKIHPNYSPNDFTHDIALLELDEPSMTQAINLADANLQSTLVENQILRVSGWGALAEGSGLSDRLFEVDIPMRTLNQCLQAYPGERSILEGGTICAGLVEGGKDSCQGDSGGPLFVMRNGVINQVGIVSWGAGCARAGSYGVYTKVSNYRLWIDAVTSDVSFDTDSFLGYVGVNTTMTQVLRIKNNGASPSRLLSVNLGGANASSFAVDTGACSSSIAPFSACDAKISITANQIGKISTVLSAQIDSQANSNLIYELNAQVLPGINPQVELDNNNISWYSGGHLSWLSFSDNTAQNGTALKSGDITDFQESVLIAFVEGPGDLAFNYKVSSENGYDFLTISHNSEVKARFSGNVNWQKYELSLAPGMNRISFSYVKDQAVLEGEDAAWIDNVVFANRQEASDTPQFPGGGSQAPNNNPIITGSALTFVEIFALLILFSIGKMYPPIRLLEHVKFNLTLTLTFFLLKL